MKRKLKTNGNSWVLYINKSFSDILGVSPEERYVELVFKEKILYLSKASSDSSSKNLLVKKLIKRGGGYGLIFTLPFQELLDIQPEKDFVSFDANGAILKISKSL